MKRAHRSHDVERLGESHNQRAAFDAGLRGGRRDAPVIPAQLHARALILLADDHAQRPHKLWRHVPGQDAAREITNSIGMKLVRIAEPEPEPD